MEKIRSHPFPPLWPLRPGNSPLPALPIPQSRGSPRPPGGAHSRFRGSSAASSRSSNARRWTARPGAALPRWQRSRRTYAGGCGMRRQRFCGYVLPLGRTRMDRDRHRPTMHVLLRFGRDELDDPAFKVDALPFEAAAVAEAEACVEPLRATVGLPVIAALNKIHAIILDNYTAGHLTLCAV